MKIRVFGIVVLAVGMLCHPAWSADHGDGSALLVGDPAADINDVYAWMSSDADMVNLVMTVHSAVANADPAPSFSDQVQYVFQTSSSHGIDMPSTVPPVNVIVEFDKAGEVSVQAGDVTVEGDASAASGIVDRYGRLRVFTGMRNDPSFFNKEGFRTVAELVASELDGLIYDAADCPSFVADTMTPAELVTALALGDDEFAGDDTLAITIEIDKSILTPGGSVLSVFGSTHKRPSSTLSSNCLGDANSDGEVQVNEAILMINNILLGCEPAPLPALGEQIDRMGRVAINIAVVDPFFVDDSAMETMDMIESHRMIQDMYNADADPLQWVANWAGIIAPVLSVYDAFDGVCGNQLLAGRDTELGRYDAFAAVLADDVLYVNTSSGTCEQYLAVEFGFGTAGDCGGRKPAYDAIDTTYMALMGDMFTFTDGVGDVGDAEEMFPFLRDPN